MSSVLGSRLMRGVDVFKSFTEETFLGNTIGLWLIVLGLFVVSYFIIQWVKRIIIGKLRRLSEKTHNDIDDFFVTLLQHTRRFFVVALALLVASRFLQISENIDSVLSSLLIVLLLAQVWFWGNECLNFLIQRILGGGKESSENQKVEGTMPALVFIGRLILASVIVLLALDNFGFDVTALVASLGVGGIAVALAVQNVLGDLFASLSIVLDKPFEVGDFVIVGDLMGNIEKIGLKTTRVRSLSGEQLIFSNADLLNSRIQNYKRMNERRICFGFGVLYQTSAEQLRLIPGLVQEIIESVDRARFDRAHFKAFGESSLDFEVIYYVTVPDYATYMDVQQRINLLLFERLANKGIEFAYPTRTLFIEKNEVDDVRDEIS